MTALVTKANVRELLEAHRLSFKGDRLTPIKIHSVGSTLQVSHWEIPFHGQLGNQTIAGAITDDWFDAAGVAKEGYFIVDAP
jgi:hypothetical protein